MKVNLGVTQLYLKECLSWWLNNSRRKEGRPTERDRSRDEARPTGPGSERSCPRSASGRRVRTVKAF